MREKLRLAILEAYGVDIDKYKVNYRNTTNAYTMNLGEYTIRINPIEEGVDKDIRLARLQWALDLKNFKNTICEPVESKNGELVEVIRIGNWQLFMSMYRTARGRLINPEDVTPMVLISAGDMLGTMHRMSMDREDDDSKYYIPNAESTFMESKKEIKGLIGPDLNNRINKYVVEAAMIKKTKENFGVCYGEYDLNNIIVDTNNIHLFDFDNSVYAHYLFDVASFAVSLLGRGYLPNRSAKEVILNHFIPWFRIGYSINKPCDEHTFDDIGLFMMIRGVWLINSLIRKYQKEENPYIKLQIEGISEILMGEDVYAGIDAVRKRLFESQA